MNVTFDHQQNDIGAALGVSEERVKEIQALLHFIELEKTFTAHKLFDKEEDVPVEFKVKTAILDSALDEAKNDNEALYITYEWANHSFLKKISSNYEEMTHKLTMLYMITNQDRDTFVKEFVKKVKIQFRGRRDSDSDED